MSVGSDGFWRPDVHAQFVTEDGAVILMRYTGLVQQTERFGAAAEADQPTDWVDQYMRLALRFETGAQQYLWLNTSLFIAKGRLLGTGHRIRGVPRVETVHESAVSDETAQSREVLDSRSQISNHMATFWHQK